MTCGENRGNSAEIQSKNAPNISEYKPNMRLARAKNKKENTPKKL